MSPAPAGAGSDTASSPGRAAEPTASDRPPEAHLTWRDDWSIGIPPLDADHRHLIELVNALLATQAHSELDEPASDQTAHSTGADALTLFESLVDHLRAHFEREEALMLSIDYADFQNHKCEHSLQIAELTDLRRQLPNNPDAALSRESLQWIKRWCFDHLVSEDRNLARAYAEITRP